MSSAVLPVSGLFEHRQDGERAAMALREKGLMGVTVRPLTETNLSLLPTGGKEGRRKMLGTVVAAPIGLIVGASVALPVSTIGGVVWAIPVGLVCGILGAILSLAFADRPLKRHRDYRAHGGVLVTAPCPVESRDEVLRILHEWHAAEVEV